MTGGKKHINIPVFIPHLGCPNQCVFCNQHAISGTCSFQKEGIISLIENILSTVNHENTVCEIAFFGGSFTGIDRDLMLYCLDTAESYVKKGMVSGIRMSTRPDYINEEILEILKRYSISEVELGIQSFSDKVLSASKRGHTTEDSIRACRLLRRYGIPFVGQMMVGLPQSRLEDEICCAEMICSLGAAGCRIYPTVVFRDTELAEMMARGEYIPLELEEAVERSAAVLDVFVKHGVRCLRIGLCETENLHSDAYLAGPNHPAMGELVGSALYYYRMCEEIERQDDVAHSDLIFEVPRGDVSLAVGQRKANRLKIENKYHAKSVRFIENKDFMRYNIKLDIKNGSCSEKSGRKTEG